MRFNDYGYGDPVEQDGLREMSTAGEVPDEVFKNDDVPPPAEQPKPEARHLAAGDSPTTMCGLARGSVTCIHPSKARKTDCETCRTAWNTLKAKKPPKEEPKPVEDRTDKFEQPTESIVVEPPQEPAGLTAEHAARLLLPGMTREELEVLRLRRVLGMTYIPIEQRMGWKDQHGNRPWRICKKWEGKEIDFSEK